ncbi:hypothetical protein, partial [Nocardia transvalensis]|uniref:hypothetical protein n=1 Tax=Nocardia transvalensis TaxID=37333 RepID=UPI001C3F36C4
LESNLEASHSTLRGTNRQSERIVLISQKETLACSFRTQQCVDISPRAGHVTGSDAERLSAFHP